ncbi:MAG: hypothetical protein EP329_09530 [Deltaproteobacteria bacterium]|nr:MAG: hypothetical protein EP329_09530 [Deltaproteobacteria bacterium]
MSLSALMAGCSGHGTAEQVAAACEHQLTVAKRGTVAAAMRAAGEDPASESGRAALEQRLREVLAEESAQQSLTRCRTLYAELSEERLTCILGATDPVAINACTPQADRRR